MWCGVLWHAHIQHCTSWRIGYSQPQHRCTMIRDDNVRKTNESIILHVDIKRHYHQILRTQSKRKYSKQKDTSFEQRPKKKNHAQLIPATCMVYTIWTQLNYTRTHTRPVEYWQTMATATAAVRGQKWNKKKTFCYLPILYIYYLVMQNDYC